MIVIFEIIYKKHIYLLFGMFIEIDKYQPNSLRKGKM